LTILKTQFNAVWWVIRQSIFWSIPLPGKRFLQEI